MSNNTSRRRKLVRVDLQLKVVFIALFVAALVLLVNFQLILAAVNSVDAHSQAQGYSEQARKLVGMFRESAIEKFLITVGLAVPLAVSIGILYSFKFCGPIYRFKMFLGGLVEGRWDQRLSLRAGDDLKDVCESINDAVDSFRSRVCQSHEFHQQVKILMERGVLNVDEESSDLVESVRSQIEREEQSFAERFPSVETEQRPQESATTA